MALKRSPLPRNRVSPRNCVPNASLRGGGERVVHGLSLARIRARASPCVARFRRRKERGWLHSSPRPKQRPPDPIGAALVSSSGGSDLLLGADVFFRGADESFRTKENFFRPTDDLLCGAAIFFRAAAVLITAASLLFLATDVLFPPAAVFFPGADVLLLGADVLFPKHRDGPVKNKLTPGKTPMSSPTASSSRRKSPDYHQSACFPQR